MQCSRVALGKYGEGKREGETTRTPENTRTFSVVQSKYPVGAVLTLPGEGSYSRSWGEASRQTIQTLCIKGVWELG